LNSTDKLAMFLAKLDKGVIDEMQKINNAKQSNSNTGNNGHTTQDIANVSNGRQIVPEVQEPNIIEKFDTTNEKTPRDESIKPLAKSLAGETKLKKTPVVEKTESNSTLFDWIKLHQQIRQSGVYQDLNAVQRDVMTQCLLMANHNEAEWAWKGQIHKCKPGQFKTSLEGIRQNCAKGTTIKMIRTALKKLEKWQFLASSGSKQGRIITIINLGTHQVKFQPGGKETGNGNYTDRNMLKQEEVMGVAG